VTRTLAVTVAERSATDSRSIRSPTITTASGTLYERCVIRIYPLAAHDIQAALKGIAAGEVATTEQDEAAFPRLASFDSGAVYVGRFAGQSPWERHPGSDELLHILEGEVEITLLTDEGPVREVVPAGSIIVVPKGVWHRQVARPSVALLSVTPDDSEVSFAEDPRVDLSP
jgi:quercetin dioxygenase-like cupin family protein